tara:strand:- start:72319 stop:72819 length:501 start_codon:yes stop_codon:yes gene_type:complete
MKEGFILVRLKTDSLKIASLEKNGYAKEAEKVKLDLYKENKEILLSFAKTFDFCPVYFFYSNHSKEIQSGDIKGKIFDYNLKLVEQEQITGKTHFVAKFGKTENLGIHALILMDSFFIPLKSPFPFYQRQYTFFSLVKLSKARVAKKLNKRLHDQYEIWTNPRWGF